jgi:dCMP deaminase
MQLAVTTGQRSTCCRRQVGAVFLDSSGHVIATGYNGVAAGQPHCNELGHRSNLTNRKFFGQLPDPPTLDLKDPASYPFACLGAFSPSGTDLDACKAIHAEQNALLQCRDVRELHTCYVTASPCITCTKLLMNTGAQRIVFLDAYPHPASGDLWTSTGRAWDQIVLPTRS